MAARNRRTCLLSFLHEHMDRLHRNFGTHRPAPAHSSFGFDFCGGFDRRLCPTTVWQGQRLRGCKPGPSLGVVAVLSPTVRARYAHSRNQIRNGRKRKGIYATYSSFAVGPACDRGLACLALQHGLGLLPERRLGIGFSNCFACRPDQVAIEYGWARQEKQANRAWPGLAAIQPSDQTRFYLKGLFYAKGKQIEIYRQTKATSRTHRRGL